MSKTVIGLAAWLFAAAPIFANGIQYACDTTDSNAIPTNVCTILQSTIAGDYAAIFSDANAYIYVEYGAPSGNVGSNVQFYNTVSYSAYYAALAANQAGPSDSTAVTSLGGGTNNPVASGQGVALTSALDQALGFSAQAYGITASGSVCNTIGSFANANGCYNDVISMSSSLSFYYDGITAGSQTGGEYDFFATVEHETNEALGTSSCLTNGTGAVSPGCDNGPNPNNPLEPCYDVRGHNICSTANVQGTSAADLFRYGSPGTRSYSATSNGSPAYFSIDGGAVDIAPYNNSPNGADYGDWSTGNCTYVQDAYGCTGAGAGQSILNDGGVEISVLDAVGYNLTAQGQDLSAFTTPEPGTAGLLLSGMATTAGFFAWRRRRSRAA